jgi:hypothetical protein
LQLCSYAGVAFAEFNAEERSINATGDTLTKGTYQLGFTDIHYGITDDITLGLPALSLIAGRGALELRKKFTLPRNWRFTPALSSGPVPYPEIARKFGFEVDRPKPYFQLSQDLGLDWGESLQHSANLGLDVRAIDTVKKDGGTRKKFLGDLRFEYDFYHAGNLFYVGLQRQLPYVGFTWAWRRVHTGIVSSPLSYFIPLPYVYFRF